MVTCTFQLSIAVKYRAVCRRDKRGGPKLSARGLFEIALFHKHAPEEEVKRACTAGLNVKSLSRKCVRAPNRMGSKTAVHRLA